MLLAETNVLLWRPLVDPQNELVRRETKGKSSQQLRKPGRRRFEFRTGETGGGGI